MKRRIMMKKKRLFVEGIDKGLVGMNLKEANETKVKMDKPQQIQKNEQIFLKPKKTSEERKKELTLLISRQLGITLSEADYFVSTPSIEKNMYDSADDSIDIIYKDGTIKNIAEASDMLNISLLSKKVKKYYICYLRWDR